MPQGIVHEAPPLKRRRSGYPLPPRPISIPFTEKENERLRRWWLRTLGLRHWLRCETVGAALGRSALAVHLQIARVL